MKRPLNGRQPLSIAVLELVLLLATAGAVAAQEPAKTLEHLNAIVEPGNTVWVSTVQGEQIKGRFEAVAGGTLVLRGKARTFKASEVAQVVERPHDSLKWGAIIGGSIGATSGAILGAACCGASEAWQAGLIYGGLGAAIGAGIDALVPMPKRLVYRAANGRKVSRLSVSPLLDQRARGVRMSFTF